MVLTCCMSKYVYVAPWWFVCACQKQLQSCNPRAYFVIINLHFHFDNKLTRNLFFCLFVCLFILFLFLFCFLSCRVFDKKEFFRQNYDRELFSFKSRLGLHFSDENILVTAFTPESFRENNVNDDYDDDNDGNDGATFTQASENNGRLSVLG